MSVVRRRSARGAFTLIEVLVAVVILAFTAVAALKLVILAQNGLGEARKKRMILDEAQSLQTEIKLGKAESFGVSGDITWDTVEKKQDILGENFGKLDFDKSGDKRNETDFGDVRWRELTVKYKDGEKIILYIPSGTDNIKWKDEEASGDTAADPGSKSKNNSRFHK
ncbi:MAG: type II secretion system GspH family protein [Synergistaceae bacterium]|nr:type II secretion system GspH family protein [Synergistaceae bacterium]